MLKLYEHPRSGHCQKVRLFLSILGLPFESVSIDVPGGAHDTADFGAINPLRQVPALIDGDVAIHDTTRVVGTDRTICRCWSSERYVSCCHSYFPQLWEGYKPSVAMK